MESFFPQVTVSDSLGDVLYNDNSTAVDYTKDTFDVSKTLLRFVDIEDGNGSALAGTVTFVDKTANTGYKDGTYQKDEIASDWFVKTLVFTPKDDTVNVEQLKVRYGNGIVSYAGVALDTFAEPELITVFFDANGGDLSVLSADADEEGHLARLYTPTREGFKFLGWFTDPEGGEQVTLSTVFTENTTIYAHWKQLPPEEESGTWGGSDQLSYRYTRKEYKVEIGGEEISESAPVFVVTFESNGRFQGLKMITDDGETANIPDGASIISLFWLDDEFAPKCDKVTIETEPEEDE
ncbi:MAG: InlB B-repeat-containing protein [Firmicutes bacterium]|nr:InlB B-repeat-containing protein [Bacillota bacterium]